MSEVQKEKNLVKTIAGAIGGTCAAVVVQPLDVIKTRQQQNLNLILAEEVITE
jgi:hypothetical protein